ncbi:MAG: hypothetical protein JNL05_13005 [Flavobacteriales bacterium]|nr:hypothetical protein [Flavobacteriales bacterium]
MKTLGETIVRTDFNAGKSTYVDMLKHRFAQLIDDVNVITPSVPEGGSLTPKGEAELARLKNEAIKHLEVAAMYAVKAQTL